MSDHWMSRWNMLELLCRPVREKIVYLQGSHGNKLFIPYDVLSGFPVGE